MKHGRKEWEDDTRENGRSWAPWALVCVGCTHEKEGKGKTVLLAMYIGGRVVHENEKKGYGVLGQIAL